MAVHRTTRPRPSTLLRNWRARLELSQSAAAVRLGVSRQTYAKWEERRKHPTMEKWFLIHDVTRGRVPWHAWTRDRNLVRLVRLHATRARRVPRATVEHTTATVTPTTSSAPHADCTSEAP